MLVESAKRYFERGYTEPVRKASLQHGQGCEPTRWRELAELGWLALPLPENKGGLGGSLADTCLIAEELGRGLLVEPYIACAVTAAGVLVQADTDGAFTPCVEALGAGEKRIALALWEPAARFDTSSPGTVTTLRGDGYVLSGSKSLVLGAPGADAFLVAARMDGAAGETGLWMVNAGMAGLAMTPHALYDGRHAATMHFDKLALPVDARVGLGDAGAAVRSGLRAGMLAHCAETVGSMTAAFEITLEYLKTRKQFGRVIASNQAVQHRLVDLYVAIEESRALCRAAAAAHDANSVDASRLASAAKAHLSHAARLVWKDCVQLHGAIGMTEEYVLGAYVRRIAAADTLYGDEHFHLERLAASDDAASDYMMTEATQ